MPAAARDRAPGGAEHGAAGDHGDDQDRRRLAREQQPHAGGADRAEVQLTLGADVEQPHPECDRGGEPGEGSGVEAMSVFVSAPSARKAASNRRRSVVIGGWPVARSRSAIAMCATTSEPSGTATISQRRCLSRFSIRSPPRFTRRPCRRGRLAAHPAISSPSSSTVALAGVDLAHDRALVHHGDAIGEGQDLVEVLADQEHRDLPRRGLAQIAVNGLDRADVETAGGRRGHEHARARSRTRARARPSAGCRPRAGGPASAGPGAFTS